VDADLFSSPTASIFAFSDDLPPRSALEAEFPEIQGKFVLLFFGRVHVKKGLDLLADALGRIAIDRPEVSPADGGHRWRGLISFPRPDVPSRPERSASLIWAHVGGERARQVWAAADAFVLPSYSEGFSMAVLEALACRLPSLITTACHFPEVAAAGGAVS